MGIYAFTLGFIGYYTIIIVRILYIKNIAQNRSGGDSRDFILIYILGGRHLRKISLYKNSYHFVPQNAFLQTGDMMGVTGAYKMKTRAISELRDLIME